MLFLEVLEISCRTSSCMPGEHLTMVLYSEPRHNCLIIFSTTVDSKGLTQQGRVYRATAGSCRGSHYMGKRWKVFSPTAPRCYGLREKQRSGGKGTQEQEGPRGSPAHKLKSPATGARRLKRKPRPQTQISSHRSKKAQAEAPPTNS